MSKHTPGPWALDEGWEESGGDTCVVNRSHDGEDWDVCRVYSSKANARLIVAAPDLLEACHKFLYAMKTSGMSNGAIRAAEDACRAAIAKAEGE